TPARADVAFSRDAEPRSTPPSPTTRRSPRPSASRTVHRRGPLPPPPVRTSPPGSADDGAGPAFTYGADGGTGVAPPKEGAMTTATTADVRGGGKAAAAVEIPGFRGRLIGPGHADYDAARAVWNGAIDRRPRLIARCIGAADVVAAVRFARDHDLEIAVRGGGHNVAGTAVCDDGIVIDLS